MASISIDYDPAKKEIHLLGDIAALQKHRYAWRYVRDYLHPSVGRTSIAIPVGESEPFSVMSNISAMLAKYGFVEVQSKTSEQVIHEVSCKKSNCPLFISTPASFGLSYGILTKRL